MTNSTIKIDVNDSYIGAMFSGVEAVQKLTDKIIAQLPPEKRDGNLIMETQDIWLYLSVTWLSVCFFFFVHYASHVLLKKFGIKAYLDKDLNKRDEYVNCITSSFEKLVLATMAVYNTITITSPDG